MKKGNNKLALMSMLTICLSTGLMNVGRLEGVAPDWLIRVIGIVTMLCTCLSIFFTVRELVKVSAKNKESAEKDNE